MMSADGIADDLHELVEARLRRVDQRYTPGRRAIIDLLVSAGHPVSIGDIAGRLAFLAASTHWLRHSYVHQLVVRHQVPLSAAQALAGHASVQTTAGYALTDQSQLRKFVSESFRDGPAGGTPPPS